MLKFFCSILFSSQQCNLLRRPVSSAFSDVFDEAHFIKSLRGDIRIVQEIPKELETAPRARKHFTSWASVGYYEEMTQLWKDYQVCFIFELMFKQG